MLSIVGLWKALCWAGWSVPVHSGTTLHKQPSREAGPVAGSQENHPGHVQAPGREPRLKEVP